MYLHRRQFIIGAGKTLLRETWKVHQISDSVWLSHCPALKIIRSQDAHGKDWWIAGLAVETSKDREAPELEISKTDSSNVPTLSEGWAGRWILIGNGKLYLDASGLLGCFYGRDRAGHVWASSSTVLLAEVLFPEEPPTVDSRNLKYETGISWYTPPLSRIEGISRLLPSQSLNLDSGKIQPKPLMPEINPHQRHDDILDQIQQTLTTTIRRLAQLSPELWLGMTAGYDSRLMLALSHAAGIQVKPFTRITARMSVADRILPPKLTAVCGYNHTLIRNPRRNPEREALAAAHTGGHVSQGDAEPFIQGIRDHLQGISFGGHGFSVASGFHKLPELPHCIADAEKGMTYISKIFQEPIDSSAMAGIEAWLDWALKNPQPYLNWRDRFFIEQRQAGWLSSKEQLYDLTDLIRFPVLNSAHLYSLLLSVNPEKRIGSEIQRELIHRINPKLSEYPYNPDDLYFGLAQILQFKGSDLPQYMLRKARGKTNSLWKSLVQNPQI